MREMIHILVAGVTLVLPTPGYASFEPSSEVSAAEANPVLPSYADVHVEPSMIDAEYARSWAGLGVTRGLKRQPIDAEQLGDRRLTVELAGSVGAYRIGVQVAASADRTAYSSERECPCSDEEMIEAVAEMVAEMSIRLAAEVDTRSSLMPPPPRADPGAARRGRVPLATMGSAGIGLTAGGAIIGGVGIGFLVVGRDPAGDFADDRRAGEDYTKSGVALAAVGAAVVVAGVVMIVLERVRAKRSQSRRSQSWRSPRGGVVNGARF